MNAACLLRWHYSNETTSIDFLSTWFVWQHAFFSNLLFQPASFGNLFCFGNPTFFCNLLFGKAYFSACIFLKFVLLLWHVVLLACLSCWHVGFFLHIFFCLGCFSVCILIFLLLACHFCLFEFLFFGLNFFFFLCQFFNFACQVFSACIF